MYWKSENQYSVGTVKNLEFKPQDGRNFWSILHRLFATRFAPLSWIKLYEYAQNFGFLSMEPQMIL